MRPHLQSHIPHLAHADACRTRRSAQRTPGRDARRSSVEPRSASRSAPLRSPIARMNNRRGRLRAHRRTPCRNGRPWYSHHVRDAFRVALPSGTAYPSIRDLSARMTRARTRCGSLTDLLKPPTSKINQATNELWWQEAEPTPMRCQLQCDPAPQRERNVITRELLLLKSMAPLEFHDAIVCFSSVRELTIDQILQSLLATYLDCSGYQRSHWMLLLMLIQTQDLHDSRSIAYVNKLHETDQLAGIVGTNNFTAVEVSVVLPLDRVEVLSVMPEPPTLANRRLVIDRLDACSEVVVENRRSDLESLLRCLARVLANILGKRLPPSLVVVGADYRDIVKFDSTVALDGRGIK